MDSDQSTARGWLNLFLKINKFSLVFGSKNQFEQNETNKLANTFWENKNKILHKSGQYNIRIKIRSA